MSGIEQRYHAGSWSNTDVYISKNPENFEKAMEEFSIFCERQLPTVWNIPFKPTCFDISIKEDCLLLGGPHGNVANYEISTMSILRDEEITISKSIQSVKFILQDNQTVALSEDCVLYILEYPSFQFLHKITLKINKVVFRFKKQSETILFTNGTPEIFSFKVNLDEEFYMKRPERKAIKIEDIPTTFNLSDDDSLLALAYENKSISIFFTDTMSKMKETGPNHSKTVILVFSQYNKHLSAAFEDFSVYVWALESNLNLKHTFTTHSGKITGISFVRENTYIVTSSEDKNINVCNLKGECQPYSMNIMDSKVLMMNGNKKHNKVFYIQEFDAILLWEVPQLPKTTYYRGHQERVTKILFIPNSFELISIGEDGQFIIWDNRMDMKHEALKLEGRLDYGLVSPSGSKAVVHSDAHFLYVVNLSDSRTLASPTKHSFRHDVLCMQISSSETKLAFGDKQNRVRVFDMKSSLIELFIIKGHILPILECYFINEDREILTASMDCTICKWSIAGNLSHESKIIKLATFLGHQAAIISMIVSPDGYVVSGSEDGVIIFWNYKGNKLYSVCCPDKIPIKALYLSQDHTYFISLQETMCTFWQLGNLAVLFQVNVTNGNSLALANDEKFVAIAENNTVSLSENPLGCSSIRIIGKNLGSPHRFMKFVLNCQKENSKVQYEMDYNHFIIAPYMIGPAHILSFCNRFNDLNVALFYEPNRASFFSTINDENPLSLCVDLEFKNCIDICLKYMRQQYNGKNTFRNLRAFYPLESCLTRLNAIDYPYIKKLYDGLFVRSEADMLPRFCLFETDLPVEVLSEHFTVISDQILPPNSSSHSGRPIVFSQSLFPLDLDLGTDSSIEFLQSILDCSDPEIFRTSLVIEYLNFKWKKVKPTVYILGFTYIFYIILLALYIVLFIESQNFLIALIVVHCILWAFEILQIATDFSDYWKNIWNIQDQLRSISFTFYAIMAWQENYNDNILLAVVIFSWSRGIACFRMFDETRYMVRLIIQVIIDIQTFFFILFYATFAFAFVYYMRDPEGQPFPMYLTQAYRLDLGDFETDLTEAFDWIIFFVATLINPLIMLNLLIAIMSDTAAAVAEIDDICNLREMAEMIMDIEKVMFWKKGVYRKFYLHKCDFTQAEEAENEDSSTFIREIKKQVIEIRMTVKNLKSHAKKLEDFNFHHSLTSFMDEQGEMEENVRDQLKDNEELISDIQKKINI